MLREADVDGAKVALVLVPKSVHSWVLGPCAQAQGLPSGHGGALYTATGLEEEIPF